MKLKVSEIFSSIEGEGVLAGTPTIFLRLASCNLRCRWCDTQYASRPGSKSRLMAADEILAALNQLSGNRISVTGGEPTHQMKGLLALASLLRQEGFQLHLETNATLYQPKLSALFHQITLSPKLLSSGNKRSIRPKIINSFLRGGSVLQVKFVISGEKDFAALESMLKKVLIPPELPLVLQPVAGKDEPADYARMGRKLGEDFRKYILDNDLGDKYDWRLLGQWQRVWWSAQRKR